MKREDFDNGWDVTPGEAIARQQELAGLIRLQPLPERFAVLGAADITTIESTKQLIAVILTFQWPRLQVLESVHIVTAVRFPYVPGLLSFREIPPLLRAFRELRQPPDVMLCDGQGLAHPRKFGLACHLGWCLKIPAVGCAKNRLCGEHQPLELKRGAHTPLYLKGEMVGSVLCTRDKVKPLYISPGHLADFDSSRELALQCVGRYRQPEPLRQAHQLATRLRRRLLA